jgi:hypothetical protein
VMFLNRMASLWPRLPGGGVTNFNLSRNRAL